MSTVSNTRGSVLQLSEAQLADYRDTYLKVQQGVHSIPPKYQNTSIESHHVRGLKIEFLEKYAENFGKQLTTHIGAAQDVLVKKLKNKINIALDQQVLEVQSEYKKGRKSYSVSAIFAWKLEREGIVSVAHSFGTDLLTLKKKSKGKSFEMWKLIECLPQSIIEGRQVVAACYHEDPEEMERRRRSRSPIEQPNRNGGFPDTRFQNSAPGDTGIEHNSLDRAHNNQTGFFPTNLFS